MGHDYVLGMWDVSVQALMFLQGPFPCFLATSGTLPSLQNVLTLFAQSFFFFLYSQPHAVCLFSLLTDALSQVSLCSSLVGPDIVHSSYALFSIVHSRYL